MPPSHVVPPPSPGLINGGISRGLIPTSPDPSGALPLRKTNLAPSLRFWYSPATAAARQAKPRGPAARRQDRPRPQTASKPLLFPSLHTGSGRQELGPVTPVGTLVGAVPSLPREGFVLLLLRISQVSDLAPALVSGRTTSEHPRKRVQTSHRAIGFSGA